MKLLRATYLSWPYFVRARQFQLSSCITRNNNCLQRCSRRLWFFTNARTIRSLKTPNTTNFETYTLFYNFSIATNLFIVISSWHLIHFLRWFLILCRLLLHRCWPFVCLFSNVADLLKIPSPPLLTFADFFTFFADFVPTSTPLSSLCHPILL